ncbi:hypothetical protein L1267_11225 [Pseudoalteromonas sp. OFAV1]|uniref:hypothetical protein n=1 Tax=Pseudoalteromonas sp. OFAV1 TaxID=2908892 RepID=UPI001F47C731|nr:hypothetical protein [Pseudoalteromonas sp. OFAV1]MCF2900976.1 hypothetical protein [Pseudoalteromonas sp. OFAV1]
MMEQQNRKNLRRQVGVKSKGSENLDPNTDSQPKTPSEADTTLTHANAKVQSQKALDGISISIGVKSYKPTGARSFKGIDGVTYNEYEIRIANSDLGKLAKISSDNHRNVYLDESYIDTSDLDEEYKDAGINTAPVKASFTDGTKNQIEIYDGQRRFTCVKRHDLDLQVWVADRVLPHEVKEEISFSANKHKPTSFVAMAIWYKNKQTQLEKSRGAQISAEEVMYQFGDKFEVKTEAKMKMLLQAAEAIDHEVVDLFCHELKFLEVDFRKLRRKYNKYRDAENSKGNSVGTLKEEMLKLKESIYDEFSKHKIDTVVNPNDDKYAKKRKRICFNLLESQWNLKPDTKSLSKSEIIGEGVEFISDGDPDGGFTIQVNNTNLDYERMKSLIVDILNK